MTPKAFFIGGDWVSSDQSSEIKNPYTHELVGRYFQAGAEQVEKAFQSTHEAFLRNRELTPAARARFLGEVATVIKRRSQEFIDLLIGEAGKPVTQAETEVARAQIYLSFCVLGVPATSGRAHRTRRKRVGQKSQRYGMPFTDWSDFWNYAV